MGNRSGASLVKIFNINPANGAARRNWWNVQAVPYELGSSAEAHVFTPPEFHRAIPAPPRRFAARKALAGRWRQSREIGAATELLESAEFFVCNEVGPQAGQVPA